MAKVVFLTCYDSYCLGIRLMGSLLEEHGHKVTLIFFKVRNEERINRPSQDPEFSQSLRGSTVYTNHYRKPLWSKIEKDLLLRTVKTAGPDLVCFSSRSFLDRENLKLLPEIKDAVPDCVLLAGGYGPTKNPELYAEVCDFVGIGEGEEVVLEISNALDKDRRFSDARNLFYKDGGKYVRNSLRPLFDVNKIDIPKCASDNIYYIEDNQLFESDPAKTSTGYTTIVGRGCAGKCSYCTEIDIQRIYESFTQTPFTRRNRSVESIIGELESAGENGFEWVYFADSFLTGSKEYLLDFFDEYSRKVKMPFWAQLHVQQMVEHPEILDAASRAGLIRCVVGIQSGSERFRSDVYNRRFSDNVLIEFGRALHERDVWIDYHIIAGNPLESEEHLEEAYNFLKRIPFRPEKDMLYCFQLRTAPGTPLTELLESRGLCRLSTQEWLYMAALYQLRVMISEEERFDEIRRCDFYRKYPERLIKLVKDAYEESVSELSGDKTIGENVTKEFYLSHVS